MGNITPVLKELRMTGESAVLWELEGRHIMVMAILVLYLGKFLKSRSDFLQRNNIPASVVGGVICSIFVSILTGMGVISLNFNMHLRNVLLLTFFSSIGLTSKFKSLIHGGKELVVFVIACVLFLVLQNIIGVGFAAVLGGPPALGLFGGSISFAGGHGTAIGWGKTATEMGIDGAAEFGMACATFGLILGGLLGGPVASRLIRKNGLNGEESYDAVNQSMEEPETRPRKYITIDDVIGTLLAFGLCLAFGDAVNQYLHLHDIPLPGFLTAMMVGLLISNTAAPLKLVKLRKNVIEIIGGVCLQLFLCMSLMSMNLASLADSALLLLLVAGVQVGAIIFFATHVVFRMMGKDYDAAVMVGGFIGMGLGATPVAIASMDAVATRHGPSIKALLVVPLVGAFFIDIINAAVITGFLKLIGM
jgi:ESS family glutamate:Na+ symporter